MLIAIITVIFIYYAYIMWFVNKGLTKLDPVKVNYKQHRFSIIVPARNEENHIEHLVRSVMNSEYPKDFFELIIINDRSTDKTLEILNTLKIEYPNLEIINQTEVLPGSSPKKQGLLKGIAKASNEIIATTDADCIVPKTWLNMLNQYYCDDVDVVCAPVQFINYPMYRIFMNIQSLDFLSLIATGAGAIGMKHPVICSGANFSYRQSCFHAVHGYEGHMHVNSGDDDLLLHKFTAKGYQIKYIWSDLALIKTKPVESLKAFIEQRKRWGSKGATYEDTVWKYRLFGIYFWYATLFFLLLASPFSSTSFNLFVTFLSIKLIIDLPIISKVIRLVSIPKLWLYVPLVEIFQIPYVTITGFLANVSKFEWKP